MSRKPTDIVPWQVRMRASLHSKLVESAKVNDVSINQEITDRLSSSFEREATNNSIAALVEVVCGGDAGDAKLIAMVGQMLGMVRLHKQRLSDKADKPEHYAHVMYAAMATLVARHLGVLVERPFTHTELGEMLIKDRPRAQGIMIADIVLTGEGYPPVIEPAPPTRSVLALLMSGPAGEVAKQATPLQKLMGVAPAGKEPP